MLEIKQPIIETDIYSFICQNSRFKNAGHKTKWHLLEEGGSIKGFFWNKNILGGWRLSLNTDNKNEWEQRGVIDTITKLKIFL